MANVTVLRAMHAVTLPTTTYGETLRPAPWELQRPLHMEGVWSFLRVQPPKLKPQILMG